MKHFIVVLFGIWNLSPLAQGRGLKLTEEKKPATPKTVAPRAGAWIETGNHNEYSIIVRVAPRAGAWIETSNPTLIPWKMIVAPRAGAWIETSNPTLIPWKMIVAPRAGAWIETSQERHQIIPGRSPLAQGRGLKLCNPRIPSCYLGRPSRRGVD